MIKSIIEFSVKNKLIIALFTLGLVVAGVYAMRELPLDAVPDITNNQVQVVTVSPNLAAQEIEQSITYPIEMAMRNLPDVQEVRSISRFGLSLITVVFDDAVEVLHARQLVKEQIDLTIDQIPNGYGRPQLMPITTGLGEVYQYVLVVENGYEQRYTPTELRSIQDWIVKRQMAGTKGIIEVSSFGGYLKQYEVAVNPSALQSLGLTLSDVMGALSRNNQNSGGSYIEKGHQAYYIRTEGIVRNLKDIENIVIDVRAGVPVLIRDIGKVHFGTAKRLGAMTMDGKGEVVGGIALMLRGANSMETVEEVKKSVERLSSSLPKGISIYPYLDRAALIDKTIHTVEKNLLEGGLIVIFILVLILGNLRAGLIAASLIPLSMLFAFYMMYLFGVSANLMSLGAVDFGIIVDGAVIIVEGILHSLHHRYAGGILSRQEMNEEVTETSARIYTSAAFGVLIILLVFVPILTLTGIEGKMFKPMALTVSFALIGAFLLSMTYVPMVAALFLSRKISAKLSLPDRIMGWLQNIYKRMLHGVLRFGVWIFGASVLLFLLSVFTFMGLGQEFIPTLEEGDLAMQMAIQPGSSLSESIATTTKIEKILKENFPEIRHVVSKIGTAEVPTDPMASETADVMIILKDKHEWVSASNREELAEKIKEKLDVLLGASFEFSQPIQLRFNELMTGSKTDIAIKIYGDNPETLKQYADKAADMIKKIDGAGDVKVELTEGLLQQTIRYDKEKMALYGLDVEYLNSIISTAFAGTATGIVFEGSARYDLVARIDPSVVANLDLGELNINTHTGQTIPLSEVAQVEVSSGPAQISHEDAQRKIDIGVNVRNRDVASLVADIQKVLETQLGLPAGYYLKYGGTFENLQAAKARLSIAVPFALLLILVLLYFTFKQMRLAILIFSAVPFAAIGGVIALVMRGMPFSISAGVGFIALFGVAVLNGIVLISSYNQLRAQQGVWTNIKELIFEGSASRLRPVLMTALVAALGFIPMAISDSNGAEVQRPLATVVIGGLITSTLLTMFVLPILYYWSERRRFEMKSPTGIVVALLALVGVPALQAQGQTSLSLMECHQYAVQENAAAQNARLQTEWQQTNEKTKWQPGNMTINYNVGQINYGKVDHQIELMQSLGNVFSYKRLRAWYQAQTAQSKAEAWQVQHQLKQEVKLMYLDWQYQYSQLALLEESKKQWQSYLDIVQKQHAAGETDALKKQMAQLQVQQIEVKIQQQQYLAQLALQELLMLARVPDGDYVPTPLPDTLAAWSNTFNDSLTAANTAQIEALAKEAHYLKTMRSPDISLGAFSQTLNQEVAFSGLKLSVVVPIRPQIPIQLKQLDLERQQQQNIIAQQERSFELQNGWAQERRQIIANNRQQIAALMTNLEQAIGIANRQVKAGEADYYDYFILLQQRYELQLQDLNLRYEDWRNYMFWSYWVK